MIWSISETVFKGTPPACFITYMYLYMENGYQWLSLSSLFFIKHAVLTSYFDKAIPQF